MLFRLIEDWQSSSGWIIIFVCFVEKLGRFQVAETEQKLGTVTILPTISTPTTTSVYRYKTDSPSLIPPTPPPSSPSPTPHPYPTPKFIISRKQNKPNFSNLSLNTTDLTFLSRQFRCWQRWCYYMVQKWRHARHSWRRLVDEEIFWNCFDKGHVVVGDRVDRWDWREDWRVWMREGIGWDYRLGRSSLKDFAVQRIMFMSMNSSLSINSPAILASSLLSLSAQNRSTPTFPPSPGPPVLILPPISSPSQPSCPKTAATTSSKSSVTTTLGVQDCLSFLQNSAQFCQICWVFSAVCFKQYTIVASRFR